MLFSLVSGQARQSATAYFFNTWGTSESNLGDDLFYDCLTAGCGSGHNTQIYKYDDEPHPSAHMPKRSKKKTVGWGNSSRCLYGLRWPYVPVPVPRRIHSNRGARVDRNCRGHFGGGGVRDRWVHA